MQNVSEILLGHHGLAGVQSLLTGAPAQEALHIALYALLDGSARLGASHLHRAKYKPGRKLTAYYDLEMHTHSDTGSYTRSIAVTWSLPENAPRPEHGDSAAPAAEPWQGGVAAPLRQLITAVPDWEMKIQVSPLDPRCPQLVRLSDPRYVRDLLATYTPSAAQDYAIAAIRYRPGQRHVLRYSPVSADIPTGGAGTMFAKLYPDESRQHFCAVVQRVADWLAVCTPGVTALRPAAYVPEDTTILYPWVDGVALSDLQQHPTRSLAHYLTQTGAALRGLHAAPARVTQDLQSQALAEELKAIAKTCEHIQVLLPAVWHTIHALLQRAGDIYATLPQEAPTFIHGDFKADHVLVPSRFRQGSGSRLTLIDFDSCLIADPAFDIGKFLADLAWTYAKSREQDLEQARSAFIAGYNLDPAHPRLLRARIVEALILVKITAHRVKLFDPNWSFATTAMVDRAAAILESAIGAS
jgi:aminoglycoside phosphotransferase (APT) family kinase protein